METIGVRVIRTLLSKTPDELGHRSLPPPQLIGHNHQFTLLCVAGRGAFGTAFFAQHSAVGQVIIKRPGLVNLLQRSDPLVPLQHECTIIRTFTRDASACKYLPKVFDAQWEVTAAAPFLPLLPAGIPFVRRWADVESDWRGAEALKLHEDIVAGLTTAHALQFCHRDVRPPNVVFDPNAACYVLIDWGLGAAPGTPMHPCNGGRPFWHDELVEASVEAKSGTPYFEYHDLASARYVAWSFTQKRTLLTRWSKLTELVEERREAVGYWPGV